jgi:hypothetical protein
MQGAGGCVSDRNVDAEALNQNRKVVWITPPQVP